MKKLTGSESQIAWAEKIRTEYFTAIEKERVEIRAALEAEMADLARLNWIDTWNMRLKKLDVIRNYVTEFESAVQWINTSKSREIWPHWLILRLGRIFYDLKPDGQLEKSQVKIDVRELFKEEFDLIISES